MHYFGITTFGIVAEPWTVPELVDLHFCISTWGGPISSSTPEKEEGPAPQVPRYPTCTPVSECNTMCTCNRYHWNRVSYCNHGFTCSFLLSSIAEEREKKTEE